MPYTTATARERELYRYYQPSDHLGPSQTPGASPRSSNDPILTAFAQLGALRVNAKRGLITLSTNCSEYIIAEAGQSLSLQQDDDEEDKLWHGIGEIKCKTGLGPEITNIFAAAGDKIDHLLFHDLSKHEKFKHKDVVVEAPFVRFLVAVPLRTPHSGTTIGTYVVVDDKPRDALSDSQIQFLRDMAVTVMDYLESGVVKRKQYRAERMVKAMGLFIEGKSSLREWWLDSGHKFQNSAVQKRNRDSVPLELQADVEFGVQDPTDEFARNGLNGLQDHAVRPTLSRSPSSSALSTAERGDGRPMLPRGASHLSSSDTAAQTASPVTTTWAGHNSSVTTLDTSEPSTEHVDKHPSVSFDLPPDPEATDVSKELQDAVLTTDLKGVFSRASNLVREAIGVEGVIYFDASVGSFGGSTDRNVMDEKAPGAFHVDTASSEDDFSRRMSIFSDSSTQEVPLPMEAVKAPEKCCNILGFSTRNRSSLRGHPTSEEHRQFPETILRRLLKRYPHGKVFNFDEDGSMSSSGGDSDYTSGKESPTKSGTHITAIDHKILRKRLSREAEADAILAVLPGARSVFWFPLWDQNRDRWFAGSLVWSTTQKRVLCPVEDLTYLAAFGNSAMAEVARFSAQLLSKMKTDFISSISHELRSPLHGVLASVEFLEETEMTEVQADMVNNIHASGKVLLDTINHVLDFSKVNRRAKDKNRMSKRAVRRMKKSREPGGQDGSTDGNSDVCLLSEEVIESIYAGHRVSKHAFGSSTERHPSTILKDDTPVTVIVDIKWRPNWIFDIDSGAWRRVLMNLFSNAMKYTKAGFIMISMSIEDDIASRGKKQRPNLLLKVKDSGKGISQEFLRHQLFKPFKQEDSLASGAGLGLSIIRHIIHDLGGHIEFDSEVGTGTEATVRIPMTAASIPKVGNFDLIAETKGLSAGLKYSLEGFERYPSLAEAPTGILPPEAKGAMLLKCSIQYLMSDWLGMIHTPPATNSHSDVVVVMEAGLAGKSLFDVLEPYARNRSHKSRRPVAIVLCNTYYPALKAEMHEIFDIVHLQQPYGPHKFAKILHKALDQSDSTSTTPTVSPMPQPQRSSESSNVPTPLVSPFSNSDAYDFNLASQETSKFWTREPATLWTQPSHMSQDNIKTRPPLVEMPKENGDIKPSAALLAQDPKPDGMRVLLVEDNEINLKLLVAYMRKLKLDHSTAINGLDAVNAYKECNGKYDVIFMDISMPVMSGIESTRHIRRYERDNSLKPVALIALTGAANPNTRQEAFSSGIDLFLTKPVPMKDLKVMLDDLRVGGRKSLGGEDSPQ